MAADDDAELPPAFICPITQEVMRDPVTAADGHSYEASAITTWLASSDLSPLTGQPLVHKELTRSHALRNAIQEHAQTRAAHAREQAALRNVPAAPSGSKVILLGDSAVGKSSLVHRVKEGTFSTAASQPTIGCSFCTHDVALPSGHKVNMAIWDTAGAEKYRAFTRQYFRGAVAAILMYDITSADSLAGAQKWLETLEAELPPSPKTILVLVGSKLDRQEERQVPLDEALQMALRANAAHLECSSKDGTNVELVFQRVATMLLQRGLKPGADGGGTSSRAHLHGAPVVIGGGPARPVGAAGCCV